MCGIFGIYNYSNSKEIAEIILKEQSSRGTDATGVAILRDNQLEIYKKAISPYRFVREEFPNIDFTSICIGHNRMASTNIHQKHLDSEAHPFLSEDKSFALVHNGTINNYSLMREILLANGHKFKSGVDSEIYVHYLEDLLASNERENAILKFASSITGNVLVLFNDGTLYGIPDYAMHVLVADKSVFIASEYEALLRALQEIECEKAIILDGSKGFYFRISKNQLYLYGSWEGDIVKEGEWIAKDKDRCDICNTYAFVEHIKWFTRCYSCYKENKEPKRPKKKKSKSELQEDTLALARCCKCGAYISVYRGVFTKEGFYCDTCWERRGMKYD